MMAARVYIVRRPFLAIPFSPAVAVGIVGQVRRDRNQPSVHADGERRSFQELVEAGVQM
jgi:hypothetical protein